MPRNVILLRGNAREESGVAATAIVPGALLEPSATANTWKYHATAAGAGPAIFAREQHENDGHGIDDEIPSGDDVTAIHPEKGAKINAWTEDTIVRGNYVESAGNGQVRAFGSGVKLGQAFSDSDLSGTYGRVEIIII